MKNLQTYELARTLKSQGQSYQDIAKSLGISRQRVQQLVSPTEKERSYLIEKNNNRCSVCGIKSDRLEVHHLDYLKDIIVILCVPCHRFLHRKIRAEKKRVTTSSVRITHERGIMELDALITIREAHDNKAILEAYAKKRRLKLADIIREAIFEYLGTHKLLPEEILNGSNQAR